MERISKNSVNFHFVRKYLEIAFWPQMLKIAALVLKLAESALRGNLMLSFALYFPEGAQVQQIKINQVDTHIVKKHWLNMERMARLAVDESLVRHLADLTFSNRRDSSLFP